MNIKPEPLPIQNQNISLDKKCIPFALNDTEMKLFERIIERRTLSQKGDLICRAGERLNSIYIVLSGSYKGYTLSKLGQEQVTSFHLPGDIIGLDSIGHSESRQFGVALETSEVCEIILDKFDALSVRMKTLRNQFKCMLSDKIYNDKTTSLLLNTKPDEARIATFFQQLGQRQQSMNPSALELRLSMPFGDIANFLNLSEASTNQILQRFMDTGLISLKEDGIHLEPLKNWDSFIQK